MGVPNKYFATQNGLCIYDGIACVSCVPFTAQSFVLFADLDEPQRFKNRIVLPRKVGRKEKDFVLYRPSLGGRINLLYCFFWGFAAIAWFKVLFPPISACIEKLPPRGGRVLTWALCIFMAADIAVSSAALVRYNDRLNGVPASNSVEVYLDGHYGNDRMYQVYPKAVHTS